MRHVAIFLTVIVLVLGGLLAGCKSDSQTQATTGEGVISGYIVDASSNARLQGVGVTAMTVSGTTQTTTSDASGMYTFKFTVDSTLNVTVTMKKTGYRDSAFVAQLKSGTVITQNFGLAPVSIVGGGGSGGTGLAQTIYFIGASQPEVCVYGVGGRETTIMSWEVRDSLGLPIDDSHSVDLTFGLLGAINGGEYVSPVVLRTNTSGQAHMTFNAGIKSGVVQVYATATVAGRTITSGPVKVIITGGYPDQAHFTISTIRFNFPALGVAGLRNPISVLVGDKYSNPAAPSAVYFSSTAGVIQGGISGTVTSSDGQGTVDLISGNPAPLGIYAAPGWGDGYHFVTAKTLGQSGVTVQDSALILWSGAGVVSTITPQTFDIPNGGSQVISFQVSDALGHPLAAGTRIMIAATIPPPTTDGVKQNQVFLTFGNSGVMELPDEIRPGPGSTQFSCILRDGTWDPSVDPGGTPVNLMITVTGPNTPNGLSAAISGVVH
jgi:hypothetical protein